MAKNNGTSITTSRVYGSYISDNGIVIPDYANEPEETSPEDVSVTPRRDPLSTRVDVSYLSMIAVTGGGIGYTEDGKPTINASLEGHYVQGQSGEWSGSGNSSTVIVSQGIQWEDTSLWPTLDDDPSANQTETEEET